jgi:hypothetical protein
MNDEKHLLEEVVPVRAGNAETAKNPQDERGMDPESCPEVEPLAGPGRVIRLNELPSRSRGATKIALRDPQKLPDVLHASS